MSEIKVPTVGRIVHYFPNGNDPIAACNNVEIAPATVVQPFGTAINLSVQTMNPDAPIVLRYSVPHKSTCGTNPETGAIVIKYWDWPEVK